MKRILAISNITEKCQKPPQQQIIVLPWIQVTIQSLNLKKIGVVIFVFENTNLIKCTALYKVK
jgi:hypothetical protein